MVGEPAGELLGTDTLVVIVNATTARMIYLAF
jgi:hypothetical protein